MTQTQAAALARALGRALKNGLRVTGKGTRKGDGAVIYGVTSASQPSRWHLVAVEGGRLSCDCPAGQRGMICQHRALVRERIAVEKAAQVIAPVVAGTTGSHETVISTHKRDTAPLRRREFSFWR